MVAVAQCIYVHGREPPPEVSCCWCVGTRPAETHLAHQWEPTTPQKPKPPRASPPDTKPADCLGAVRVRLGRGGAVAPGAGVSACSGCFLCFPGWCYTTAAAAAPGSSMPHYNSSTAGTSRGCTAPPNMHLSKHDLADAIVR